MVDPRADNEVLLAIERLTEMVDAGNKVSQKTWDRVEEIDKRLTAVEEKIPPTIPPTNAAPRTISGFNAAVRNASQPEIDQITRLEATVKTIDAKTDAQNAAIESLEKRGAAIEKKTDLQTLTLNKILGYTENPMVRKVLYVAAGAFVSWVMHHGGLIP